MPGGGIETAEILSQRAPATAVVMLTVSANPEDMLAALRSGAKGYLSKDTSPERLPAALCGVLKGEAALPRTLVGTRAPRISPSAGAGAVPLCVDGVELTARESEILRMLGSGLSTLEMGELLSLSPITVRRHISAGVAKLGVDSRDEAIRAIELRRGSAPGPDRLAGAPQPYLSSRPSPSAQRRRLPAHGCAPPAFRRCSSHIA